MREISFSDLWADAQSAKMHLCVGLDPTQDGIPLAVKEQFAREMAAPFGAVLSKNVKLVRAARFSHQPPLTTRMLRAFMAELDQRFVTQGLLVIFAANIVDAVAPYTRVFKPNLAFWLRFGTAGVAALKVVIDYIYERVPGALVILDAKWLDIGNTNNAYLDALDWFGVHAVTLHSYLGWKAGLEHFVVARPDLGFFVLCRTTNPGAKDFQDLGVMEYDMPLYQVVATMAETTWNEKGNVGLVTGATFPAELAETRKIWKGRLLIPGIGKQKGALAESLDGARLPDGTIDSVVNLSSAISGASMDADYAEKAGEVAATYHKKMTLILAAA
ncbi:MAG: orotidine-5'-phosphate decarboxylase [Patescibacteria group bacterium]